MCEHTHSVNLNLHKDTSATLPTCPPPAHSFSSCADSACVRRAKVRGPSPACSGCGGRAAWRARPAATCTRDSIRVSCVRGGAPSATGSGRRTWQCLGRQERRGSETKSPDDCGAALTPSLSLSYLLGLQHLPGLSGVSPGRGGPASLPCLCSHRAEERPDVSPVRGPAPCRL